MEELSLVVRSGADAERFNNAFYRFLELNRGSWQPFQDCCCTLQTLPEGDYERKLVRFWSQEAADRFLRFWRARSAGDDHRPWAAREAAESELAAAALPSIAGQEGRVES